MIFCKLFIDPLAGNVWALWSGSNVNRGPVVSQIDRSLKNWQVTRYMLTHLGTLRSSNRLTTLLARSMWLLACLRGTLLWLN